MIEKTVIDYLGSALNVPVGPQVPPGPPAKYCTVERRGRDDKNRLQAALIAVVSAAPSLWEAMNLSEAVRGYMELLPTLRSNVFSCRCSDEYNSTDPETAEFRYTATFRLTFTDPTDERSQNNG